MTATGPEGEELLLLRREEEGPKPPGRLGRWCYEHLVLRLLQALVHLVTLATLAVRDAAWWVRIHCYLPLLLALLPDHRPTPLAKVPEHVGVLLIRRPTVEALLAAAVDVVDWILQEGEEEGGRVSSSTPTPPSEHRVRQVTLYDEAGLLKRHAQELALRLEARLRVGGGGGGLRVPVPRVFMTGSPLPSGRENLWLEGEETDDTEDPGETDSRTAPPREPPADGKDLAPSRRRHTPAAPSPTPRSAPPPRLAVNLLSRADGKPALLHLAHHLPLGDLTPPALDASLLSPTHTPHPSFPQLLLIFDHPAHAPTTLHGFPPWHLAQAELLFLPGDGRPRPWQVREALCRYQRIEQRHGK